MLDSKGEDFLLHLGWNSLPQAVSLEPLKFFKSEGRLNCIYFKNILYIYFTTT